MKATELLAEVKAEQELNRIGYTKIQCEVCKGTGYMQPSNKNVLNDYVPKGLFGCGTCGSSGKLWLKPDGLAISAE